MEEVPALYAEELLASAEVPAPPWSCEDDGVVSWLEDAAESAAPFPAESALPALPRHRLLRDETRLLRDDSTGYPNDDGVAVVMRGRRHRVRTSGQVI